ncbi:cupin domain-containing protein [Desulfonatronum sp. SC1]|uniref:cupin domain-containing protein n=1 Tax=Desulfonatronum sp. SC1 TaxID=2109626 RepID=UPI000D2F513A|nr:cupin domain-containing protein [Desulfonatronum sp. SC1]PTN33020.1 cupin domain-containing protein [Desulfonatronum sp. SC1]
MRLRLTSIFVIGWFTFLGLGSVAAKDTGVMVRELARTETSWDGVLLPSYPEGQPEVRILSITIAPGTKLPVHQHPVINAGILLSGHLRVHTLDGQVLDLKAGEAIVEVVGTWHWGESVGDEPAHIVVFYAGTTDLPITQIRE